MRNKFGVPAVVDRGTFQAELGGLRVREKAHTREGDAIAAARRRLPMVEVNGATPLIGGRGTLTLSDAFEGRLMLIAYYFMWHTGHPAPEQCEGCTFYTSKVRELSYLHSRDATFAVLCQGLTKRASGTATSWAGRCLGTLPRNRSTPSWLDAEWACFTSFATCDKDPTSSRLTGRRGAVLRRWTTATACST